LSKVISRGMIIHRIFNLSLKEQVMAKKRGKRKVKRKRRKTPDRYKPLVSKLQSKGLLDKYDVEVRYEPRGVAKMSQVVIDFIEPYAEYAETIFVNLRGMALTKVMFVFQSDSRNGINKSM